MSKKLKRGYSTGVHASLAFKSAFEAFLYTKSMAISITNKMDNDDLDMTKGCEIVVTISDKKEDLELTPISHEPYIIGYLELYSGVGVGVVTKDGLKPSKGYPAINPIPLKAISDIYNYFSSRINDAIYTTISVTNGEEIAKQTANAKVGVLGGISILGTTGFVKPISVDAYMDSILAELKVAKANGYNQAVLTLGNSSFAHAKENYDEIEIVEIGNFIYDTLGMVNSLKFDYAIFVCGIGKATKVMQGCKNTHNRFGSIDFVDLKNQISNQLNIEVDIESTKTVKGISAQLKKVEKIDQFYDMVRNLTDRQLKAWYPLITTKTIILRVMSETCKHPNHPYNT
jgi:cobalt-precorrin-5B (C1)-methyltransferase